MSGNRKTSKVDQDHLQEKFIQLKCEFDELKAKYHKSEETVLNLKQQSKSKQQLIDELNAEKAWLKALVDNIPVGIVMTDPDGKFVFTNRQADATVGGHVTGDAAGLMGGYAFRYPDGSVIPPKELPILRVIRQNEVVKDYEILVRLDEGKNTHLLVNALPVRNSEADLYGAIAVLTDITERKEIERALQESQARLADALECMQEGFVAVSMDWSITYINQKLADSIKERSEDLVGRNFWEAFPNFIGTSVEENLHLAMQQRKPIQFITRGYHGKNWYEIAIYPTKEGLSGFANDRTKEKLAEARLESLAKFPGENPDPVVRTSIDGKILYANAASEQLLKYWEMGENEILPEPICLLVQDSLESDLVVCDEVEVGNKIYSLSFVPVSCEKYVNIYASDITSRKHLEIELKEYSARLEESNEDLERFAFIASHDLQEPLRKIKSFGDRVRERLGNKADDESLMFLDRMQDASKRMQNMIDDLLELSRVTTRGRPFISVDLNNVAEDVLSDLDGLIQRLHGIVEVDILPEIKADPVQMHQLLQNLISNALKFNKSGVAPNVKVYVKQSQGSDQRPVIKLYVRDNGIGFDQQYVDRIFQPFERLVGRSQYEGSGIGLAICKKIAERHCGTITARSKPGEGSTFIVTLPL